MKRTDIVKHLIFWPWNLLFLCTMFAGFLPLIFVELVRDASEGFLPLEYLVTALALLLIPLVATLLGMVNLRNDPQKLLALFFGVEAPLFWLGLVRMFLLRELTPATTYVLALMIAGTIVFAVGIFREKTSHGTLSLIAHAACLLNGLYLAILIGFYAVPAGASFLTSVASLDWLRSWSFPSLRDIGTFMLVSGFALLFLLSAALFAAMPFALVALHIGRWRQVFRAYGSPIKGAIITGLVLVAAIAGFEKTNVQPQQAVLARLAHPPATDAERRALIADQEAIRAGLLNAYLAPYRYAGSIGNDHHISGMYRDSLGIGTDGASAIEALFHVFARPMLYDGESLQSDEKAAALYEAFFDAPIQKGEKDAILRALQTTYERDSREAGLLNEGGRKVLLERQTIDLVERDTDATIEIHEVYANQTREQQEVLYYFSLPPSAVITGLWLGDTDDREKRFPFAVATRGAAQAVYKAEVQRRVDPALLEQVGPRQYRLRAFPIPEKIRAYEEASTRPTRMHLWLRYTVLPDDGTWPLPIAAERRNIYADSSTERTINGRVLRVENAEDWLPRSIPASAKVETKARKIAIAPGKILRADPIDDTTPRLPAPGKKYAIVLDRSFSMSRHVPALERAFAWLDAEIAPHHDLDLYLTSSKQRGESPIRIDQPRGFDPRNAVYFGTTNPGEMIAQYARLKSDTVYDAILLVTDEGTFELATDDSAPKVLDAPLWMVHAGGELPRGYDDATLALLATGGVTTTLARAFAGIASGGAIEDGYRWTIEDGEGAEDWAQIGAHQFVRKTKGTDLGALDRLHGIALAHGIVTPISSMIVLVNDDQRRRLAEAETADDRYDREVETGKEQLTKPHGGLDSITATPEPEEWVLLICVAAFLLYVKRTKNREDAFSAA